MCIDNQVSMLNHLNSICCNNVHSLCIDKYIMDFENNAQFIFTNHSLQNNFCFRPAVNMTKVKS